MDNLTTRIVGQPVSKEGYIELTYQCPVCYTWFIGIEAAEDGKDCCKKAKHIDIYV
jgi:hypothetical protein